MCDLDTGRSCNNYSTCPILISTMQRSYMNRTLDAIFNSLHRIEKLLESTNGHAPVKKEDKNS